MSEHLPLLAETPLFGSLDHDELVALSGRFELVHIEPGRMLFESGDPGEILYLVRSGRVRVFLENDIGDVVVLSECCAGDILGEISLFDGGPRTANAQAVEATEVLCLGRDDITAFLSEHPSAALDLLAEMGRRLRKTDDLLRTCVSRNLNEEQSENMTFGERVADRVASFGGSWTFIIFFGLLLLCWMGVNVVILVTRPFDPYPFILLNLVLSTLAALQAPVIMMSQNRQSSKDRLKADLDYQVNLKAELEIASLHRKVDRLYEVIQARRSPDRERPA
jgi:uncharacterized membrane protein